MNTHMKITGGLTTLCITVVAVGVLDFGESSYAQSECDGMPYGTDGCPVRDELSEEMDPLLCGNGVSDPGEECDLARFNGISKCTRECKLLYCGDGTVSAFIGEECEPETEEIYTIDPATGNLATTIKFVEKTCGITCTSPRCTGSECSGGCKVEFLGPCEYEARERNSEKILAAQEEMAEVESEEAAEPTLEESEVEEAAVSNEKDEGLGYVGPDLKPSEEVLVPDSHVRSIPLEEIHLAAPEKAVERQISQEFTQGPLETFAESGIPSTCGDGVVDEGEECDDGNLSPFDSCLTTCVRPLCGNGIKEGLEECDDGNGNNYDACPNDCTRAICGDNVVEGSEQCDDGNVINTDACLNNCTAASCGNGIREGDEECDDGNNDDFDTCPSDCRVSVCGDGIREGHEECDDSNSINSDACSNACVIGKCGDGIVQDGEDCDDGNTVHNDACNNSCQRASCGDGIVQKGEECDDANQINTDECTNACRQSICGDGLVQKGEECDDGNRDNLDLCPNDCLLPVCGDGIREGLEQCDDGNGSDTDLCPGSCRAPVCGNGIVEGREQCDDGNAVAGDGCGLTCFRESVCGNALREGEEECDHGLKNSDTEPNSCRTSCMIPYCGDGVADAGEECDGDGRCTTQCIKRPLFPEMVYLNEILAMILFTLGSISAVAYFFRKELNRILRMLFHSDSY